MESLIKKILRITHTGYLKQSRTYFYAAVLHARVCQYDTGIFLIVHT